MDFQTDSSRYNFFVKWRNVQLCMKFNFITKFFIYCPWFSRNNSISGATSLKALRNESLVIHSFYHFEFLGPAQAAFNGLIPGRAYNISVETVSEDQISEPTTAQYRTVPWRPHNVTFDPTKIGTVDIIYISMFSFFRERVLF